MDTLSADVVDHLFSYLPVRCLLSMASVSKWLETQVGLLIGCSIPCLWERCYTNGTLQLKIGYQDGRHLACVEYGRGFTCLS